MSFAKKGASALGKLVVLIVLAGTFIVGMVGVVYMSLQGTEMKVPELTGKDFAQSEKELAAMGLRIKKRADRFSSETPNTVLEQLPKAGDTVKTGQMILVVTSKFNPDGGDVPAATKKSVDTDDSEKIEELISDKPKKAKANTNSNSNKKKASTTRDVASDNSNSNSNSDSSDDKKSGDKNTDSGDKANKNSATNSNKSSSNSNSANKPNSNANKSTVVPKPPVSGGDVRPRKTPQP